VHDYDRRSGVVHAEIMAPEATPDWMMDRTALWNAVEVVEKRKDAQLSREVQLALPHELDATQRLSLVRDYVRQAFVARGMVADIAIHAPHRQGDDRNHHAHVMLTMREIAGDSFGKKDRTWNETSLLEHWRETWQEAVNRALERAGHAGRVDHRRLEEQRVEALERAEQARSANDNVQARVFDLEAARLDRDPEPKIGAIAMALERRGEETERGNLWREVVNRNLDRFGRWIALQRARVDALWERLENFNSRQNEQLNRSEGGRSGNESERLTPKQFTIEQRDRLLGRTIRPPGTRLRDKEDRER
jgi:ATP-dependent exoDNAse (exonuclease V) alpha subunit